MRTVPFVRRALVCAVALLIATACGSDSTGPDYDDTFTEGQGTYGGSILAVTITQSLVAMFDGDPLSRRVEALAFTTMFTPRIRSNSRLILPAPGVSTSEFFRQVQASAPGCAVSGHGSDGDLLDPYDGNGNDIADDYAIRVECSELDSIGEGVTVTYKEVYDLRLKERLGIDWGFDASLRLWSSERRSDESAAEEEGYDLTERLVVDDGKATYHQTVSSWGKGLNEDEPTAYDDGGDLTLTFVSDGDPFVLHEYFPAGMMTVTGRTYFTQIGDANLEWKITTSNALTYSPGCDDEWDQPFVAGELSGALSGSSSKRFTVVANPCDSASPWTISATGFEAP